MSDSGGPETFSGRLRAIMSQKNMTQAQLAQKSGLPRDRISYYVHHGQPRPEKLKKLAVALGVQPRDLMPDRYAYAAAGGAAPGDAQTSQARPSGNYAVTGTNRPDTMRLTADIEIPAAVAFEIAAMIARVLSEQSGRNGASGSSPGSSRHQTN